MNTSIANFLEEGSKIKNKKERIEFFRTNSAGIPDNSLKIILNRMFYDEKVWDFPKSSKIEYKPSEMDVPSCLVFELTKLHIYSSLIIDPKRKLQIFTQVLEYVNAEDAELLLQLKDKKFKYKNLTKAFFEECYPAFMQENDQKR